MYTLHMPTSHASIYKQHPHLLAGGDGYDLAFANYTQSKGGKFLSSFLNEKRYTIKDTEQTYRIINHWSSLCLLEDERTDQSKWRKLSLLDLLWIHAVVELREFGFPLEKVRTVRESLFPRGAKGTIIPFFEFAIAEVIAHKTEQCLIVFDNGSATAISGEMLDVNHRFSDIENYICINLNRVVSKVLKGKDFSPAFRNVQTLNEDETEVLLNMRSGKYESVSVKMKNGEIELIEATESIESQKKLIELLKDADYQNIEVKTRDGKIASIKRTVKKKTATKATGRPRASSSTEPLRSSDDPTSDAVPSHAHH